MITMDFFYRLYYHWPALTILATWQLTFLHPCWPHLDSVSFIFTEVKNLSSSCVRRSRSQCQSMKIRFTTSIWSYTLPYNVYAIFQEICKETSNKWPKNEQFHYYFMTMELISYYRHVLYVLFLYKTFASMKKLLICHLYMLLNQN